MSVIHTPRKPLLDVSTLVFPITIWALLFVLFLRLWYFQIVLSTELTERARRLDSTEIQKLAPRGLIYDRKGKLLAGVMPRLVLTAQWAVVRKHPEVIDQVAAMLGVDRQRLDDKLKAGTAKPYWPTPIFVGCPIEVATMVAEAGADLPGIAVESQPMRYYTEPVAMAHVLGYVWVPSEDDVKRLTGLKLEPASYVGKTGIEYTYESELMGHPGVEKVEMDAKRRPIRIVGRDRPIPGSKLVLTIDSQLQKFALELLNGHEGSVVALDPATGEILCLASAPSFDASLFLNGVSAKDLAALNADPQHPQYNRAVHANSPPGSTFKLVTSMASARVGKFDPNWTENCPGYYRMGDHKTKCLGVHGTIAFHEAFVKSCNTYFSALGVMDGADALRETATAAGLGRRSGIDLRSEDAGVVPTQTWLDSLRHPKRWYPGDTVNMAIGQGYLRTSPLQMADLMALVANSGVSYRPHLVKSIEASGSGSVREIHPEEANRIDADPSFWTDIHSALVDVVERGTAAGARIPGLLIGGKTGSAEHVREQKTDSWFVGYAPADAPKIVICVLVEKGGHGSDVAAPIATKVIQRYLCPPKPISPPNKAASASALAAAGKSPAAR